MCSMILKYTGLMEAEDATASEQTQELQYVFIMKCQHPGDFVQNETLRPQAFFVCILTVRRGMCSLDWDPAT